MIKNFCCLLMFLFSLMPLGKSQSTVSFTEWIKVHDVMGESIEKEAFALSPLKKEDVKDMEQILDSLWRQSIRNKYASGWKKGVFEYGSLKMNFAGRILGKVPSDGRSLYISMHGGGNAPAEANDQQWKNQVFLYTPKEGIYIAPRAPWNDWNMWFKPGLDEIFEMLIQCAVAEANVNPDKVYLLGYSAGGDGVWRVAPRMADHWAAASMMAGHPGEASQLNLRNLPYMIWMGEHDAAYQRNALAAEKGKILDSLQMGDPEGYIHETHIVSGKGHWMDRADTAAIDWMAKYRRNPYPQKIVWRQEEVVRPAFYWLWAPEKELKPGAMVTASYEGNEVTVHSCDYSCIKIGLNDQMMDLDKPVKVWYEGKLLFKGKVKRTLQTMVDNLKNRGDIRYMFPAVIELNIR